MGDKTYINWCDATWNPIRGCSRVSEGCRNCYAERVAHRFSGPGQPYEGLVRKVNGQPAWTGKVRFLPEKLDQPLRWTRPRRIFVNSMSDLFHSKVSNKHLAMIFAAMALARHHTFLVLTKRPARALEWFTEGVRPTVAVYDAAVNILRQAHGSVDWKRMPGNMSHERSGGDSWWPLPNVHFGVSVEDQVTADQRIPLLIRIPAAVRWVSYEPALGPVDFEVACMALGQPPLSIDVQTRQHAGCYRATQALDWIVGGGESGVKARSCNIEWLRSMVDQCRAAGVPAWVKQLGARPMSNVVRWVDAHNEALGAITHKSGEDWDEWPVDLRVRELPKNT